MLYIHYARPVFRCLNIPDLMSDYIHRLDRLYQSPKEELM